MYSEVLRRPEGTVQPAGTLNSGSLHLESTRTRAAEAQRAADPTSAAAGPSTVDGGGYYDVSFDWIKNESLRVGVTRVYPYACKVVGVMEWIGGKVANATGLTQSRFQYAVDEYYRRERKRHEKELLEEAILVQRARERGLLRKSVVRPDGTVEIVDDDSDDDVPYAPPVVTRSVPRPAAMSAALDANLLSRSL
jgi:hypothetical protein